MDSAIEVAMGRREAPVPDGPLKEFALALRALRVNAPGAPTYRQLADEAHYSASVLSVAAAGRRLPSLDVTLAFVRACGGDTDEWRERWTSLHAELQAHHPDLIPDLAQDLDGSPAAPEPLPPSAVPPRTRFHGPFLRLGLGAAVIVVLAAAAVFAADEMSSSGTNGRTGARHHSTTPSPQAWTATSGPSCATGHAVAIDTTGSWTPLPGSATGGCGEALTHRTTDNSDGANWVFYPGVGKTCTFKIYIPNSTAITARNVTYQAWDTLPGKHFDPNRIGGNVRADQFANRGGAITLTFGPTKNGTIDLQIYDNYQDNTVEVADTVAATCR
ncbi:helix-turn-helix domain-containing protein [Actinoallomurus sp. CA-150999]|uniref:helix-turn-helix domain-containing protein n=1 Tax=Actinoallomurus sp. CA-150999 TaxID=3239887 RepID=UPI003D8C9318